MNESNKTTRKKKKNKHTIFCATTTSTTNHHHNHHHSNKSKNQRASFSGLLFKMQSNLIDTDKNVRVLSFLTTFSGKSFELKRIFRKGIRRSRMLTKTSPSEIV